MEILQSMYSLNLKIDSFMEEKMIACINNLDIFLKIIYMSKKTLLI
jgi:hypothetical protein